MMLVQSQDLIKMRMSDKLQSDETTNLSQEQGRMNE